jgi:hypothetical protein
MALLLLDDEQSCLWQYQTSTNQNKRAYQRGIVVSTKSQHMNSMLTKEFA